jgi:hypothetical protein
MVFWDVAACSYDEGDRRFRGAYCLHHQGETYVHFNVTTRFYIPENSLKRHSRRRENLKSHKLGSSNRTFSAAFRRIWCSCRLLVLTSMIPKSELDGSAPIAPLVTPIVVRCLSVGGVRSLPWFLSFSSTLSARECSKPSLVRGGCFFLSSQCFGSSCHDNRNRRERVINSRLCDLFLR